MHNSKDEIKKLKDRTPIRKNHLRVWIKTSKKWDEIQKGGMKSPANLIFGFQSVNWDML